MPFICLSYDVLTVMLTFLLLLLSYNVDARHNIINLQNSLPPPCPCLSTSGYNLTSSYVFNQQISQLLFVCVVETLESKKMFSKYSPEDMNINIIFLPEMPSFLNLTYDNKDSDKEMTRDCSSIIELTSSENSTSIAESIIGPGICIPKPFLKIPVNSLLPPYDMNRTLSLTLTTGSVVSHHVNILKDNSSSIGSIAHGIGIILRSIARRRVEECKERGYWPLGSFARSLSERDIHSSRHTTWNNNSYLLPHKSKFERRKVYGLIIWIGTNARRNLLNSQLQVLSLQNQSLPANEKIFGWAATEDSYSCRIANDTRQCGHSYGYHWMLPSTQLASRGLSGWGCGQRRPLRLNLETDINDNDCLIN
jgi:hypothetical protein